MLNAAAQKRYNALRLLAAKLASVTPEEAAEMTDEAVVGIVYALPSVVMWKEVAE